MQITRLERRRNHGALTRTAANAQHTWAERAGLLLVLHDEDGHVGLGEASPLPGYSRDALEDVELALGALELGALTLDDAAPARPAVAAGPAPVDVARLDLARLDLVRPEGPGLDGVRRAIELLPPSLPAARFALETALLDLLAQRARAPVHALLVPRARPLPLSGLLAARTPAEVVAEAEALVEEGHITLKLKLGLAPLDEEVALLAALRRALPGDVRLRLDGNGQTRHPLPQLLAAVAPFGPELFEEPGPLDAVCALERSPVPLALDESLQRPDGAALLATLADRGLVRFAVLKPAALGGALACLALAEVARAHHAEPIVTHLFDGPVAHAAASHLAFAVQSGVTAAGLALHGGLDAWPATRVGWVAHGALLPPKTPGLLDELGRVRLARGVP